MSGLVVTKITGISHTLMLGLHMNFERYFLVADIITIITLEVVAIRLSVKLKPPNYVI